MKTSALASIFAFISVNSVNPRRGKDGPGVKVILMSVPNILFISAWARFAPSVPPSVAWPHVIFSRPSSFAAATTARISGLSSTAMALTPAAIRPHTGSKPSQNDIIRFVMITPPRVFEFFTGRRELTRYPFSSLC